MVVVEAPLWNADVLTMCALCTLRDKAPSPAWGIIPASHSMLPTWSHYAPKRRDVITLSSRHPAPFTRETVHAGFYSRRGASSHMKTTRVLLWRSPRSDNWDVTKSVQGSFHRVVFMRISQSLLKSVLHNISSDCVTFLCYALGASCTATTQSIRLMGFYNAVPSGGQNGHCLTQHRFFFYYSTHSLRAKHILIALDFSISGLSIRKIFLKLFDKQTSRIWFQSCSPAGKSFILLFLVFFFFQIIIE